MDRTRLALLLSFTGGYVDTLGFLALSGLFTAHVTGNIVTLGAAIVSGSNGIFSKLFAIPVFCVVVSLTHVAELKMTCTGSKRLRLLLLLEFILLGLVATVALLHGPFRDPGSAVAVVAGMILVAAMAVQNALHRVHLAALPPSTVMTGTATQALLDIAELAAGSAVGQSRCKVSGRLKHLTGILAGFVAGSACSATAFSLIEPWCFLLPPLLLLVVLSQKIADV